MAHRMVSARNEPCVSAAVSNVNSVPIISVDSQSITSDSHTMTLDGPAAELGAKSMTLPGAGGSSSSTHNSHTRHDSYFFQDGNVTFLVDGTLYCVHRYFFSRDSSYFSTKFTLLGTRDHEPLRIIISLGDIEREDFEAFLSVVYPENFGEHNLSYEQWVSVLHLSSLWGFASLRKLALKSIQPPNACEKLLLARTYGVDNWALSALSSLCERKQPIGLEEARQMTIENIVLVATVREEIRLNGFRVKTARIPGMVEAAQAGISVYIANEDVVPVVPEKDITEDSSKQAAAGSSIEGDGYDRPKEAAVATPSEKGHGNRRGSHEHLASTTAETQEEKIGRTYDQPPTPTPAPKVTSENEVDGWPALPVNTKKGEGVNKAYRVFRSGIGSTKTFVRAKSDTHLEVNTANGVMQGGIS